MTKKKAFQLTYECWVWVSEHWDCDKTDFPKAEKLSLMHNGCACCEYFRNCKDCYLFQYNNQDGCDDHRSLYFKWLHAFPNRQYSTKKAIQRSNAAKKIAELTKEFMIQEGMWDE